MIKSESIGIAFIDRPTTEVVKMFDVPVLHVLCTAGSMSFVFRDVRYNVGAGDYVILPNSTLAAEFSAGDDFEAVTMVLSENSVMSLALRSNYGIVGHLSLLRNPVMKLEPADFRRCLHDMERLRERLAESEHLFHAELIEHLLVAHILDLYDIHARHSPLSQISERATSHLRHFIELLYKGEFVRRRDVPYYASQLCVTPHYLTEICKKTSGEPASYWISRFAMHEITRLLREKSLPLAEISERMNFSSVSYFSRYVQKMTGLTPSEYRNRL